MSKSSDTKRGSTPDRPTTGATSASAEQHPGASRPGDATRNRLLAALVGLMALACVFLALLLVTPAKQQAAPTATVTVTAPGAQPQQPQQQPSPQAQQPTFDEKGFGQLGDRARRSADDHTGLGRTDAPVVVVEWADYACPFCAVWARDQQKQLVEKYVKQGVVRLEWRDLVIFGEKSQRAAQAARAAGLQGRFWEFHEALFAASPTSGHPDLSDDKLTAFARQAGVADLAKWSKDMASPEVAALVRKDTQEAQGFGANSTPVFSVNGIPLVGAQPLAAFEKAIQAAAQEQKKRAG